MFFMDYLFQLISVLLSIAFLTLLERKILSYSNLRKGPNKVSMLGMMQPISDATKLFTKKMYKVNSMLFYLFIMGPIVGMMIMLLTWMFCPNFNNTFYCFMVMVLIFSLLSMEVYFLILSGIGSNSTYAIVGVYRAVSQTISYEVCLMLMMMIVVCVSGTFCLINLINIQISFWISFMSPTLSFFWMILMLAESNRSPFDFAEGESELVSGFNIEYAGSMFSIVFICEYGMMMALSYISTIMMFGGTLITAKTILLCSGMIWVRATMPRIRYDMLMNLAWKMMLPMTLTMLLLMMMFF